MKVKNEMTAGVETVTPEASVWEVSRKMRDRNIGAIPVCENARLIGIVTDRDITVRSTAEALDPVATKVIEILTPGVEWCFEDDEVENIAVKMERNKIRRLPVVNNDRKLVGMISIGDLAARGSSETAGKILERVSMSI